MPRSISATICFIASAILLQYFWLINTEQIVVKAQDKK